MLLLEPDLTSVFLCDVSRGNHDAVAAFLKSAPDVNLKIGSPLSEKMLGTQTTFDSFHVAMEEKWLEDESREWASWAETKDVTLPRFWYRCRVWRGEPKEVMHG